MPYHSIAINAINGKRKVFLCDKTICFVVTVQVCKTMEAILVNQKPNLQKTEAKFVI